MKKTYKLIKEYPGSPKIGFILNDSWKNNYGDDRYVINGLAFRPENHKEFWEEVIEKDYEILSLTFIKDDNWLHDLKRGQVVKCRSHRNGHLEFETSKGWDAYSGVEGFQKIVSEVFSIHSVKRLSDGEIFTIGDNVSATDDNIFTGGAFYKDKLSENNAKGWVVDLYNTKIHSFKLVDNVLCIMYDYNINRQPGQPIYAVLKLEKPKPLFTTEDGVDIFENDNNFITVCKITFKIYSSGFFSKSGIKNILNHSHLLKFSTKEKAEEYILLNKPCLSINDLNPIFQEKITIGYQSLIEVVKKKLNK